MKLSPNELVIALVAFLVFAIMGAVLLFSFFPPAVSVMQTSFLTMGASILWFLIIMPLLGTYTFVYYFYKQHRPEHYNLSLLMLAGGLFASIATISSLVDVEPALVNQPVVLSANTQLNAPENAPLPTPTPQPITFARVLPLPKGAKAPAGTLAYTDLGQINSVGAGGKNQKVLTNDDTIKFGLLPSPDGNTVAYRFYPLNTDFEAVSSIDEADAGVAIVHSIDGEVLTLATADEHRFLSLAFSPDGKYLSMKSFDGDVAKIVEVSSGIEISSVKGKPGTVSAMVWLPNNRVSYVSDGKLILADAVGPAFETPVEGADAVTPAWSPSGRYAAFVKGEKLHLFDMQNETDVVIGGKNVSVIGWNVDETMVYLNDPSHKKPTVVMNLSDGSVTELGALDGALLSLDRTMLAAGSTVVKLADNTTKSCKEDLTSVRWHTGNEYVLGMKITGEGDSVTIVNATTCSSYDLVSGKYLQEAVWVGK